MALVFDYAIKRITIPQADLSLVGGTLYDLDSNQFRLDVISELGSETGMFAEDAILHNTEVTVAGTTFARTIEIINGWSVVFEDGQYSVRLLGSNNNIFDVASGILIQNQVQVISNNSAGLITVTQGSGVTPQDKLDIKNLIFNEVIEAGLSFDEVVRILASNAGGTIVQDANGNYVIKGIDGTTDRIIGSPGPNDGRQVNSLDGQ